MPKERTPKRRVASTSGESPLLQQLVAQSLGEIEAQAAALLRGEPYGNPLKAGNREVGRYLLDIGALMPLIADRIRRLNAPIPARFETALFKDRVDPEQVVYGLALGKLCTSGWA